MLLGQEQGGEETKLGREAVPERNGFSLFFGKSVWLPLWFWFISN